MSTLAPPLPSSRSSDWKTLSPWYLAEFLGSYSSTLFLGGCYDFAQTVIGASPSQRLGLSALWGFEYIFISLLAGRASEKFGPRASTIAAFALTALTASLGLFAIHLPSLWLLALVMFPFNLTCTMIWPAIESGLTRTPAKMGLNTRTSLYNLSWGGTGFAAIFTHGLLESWSWSAIMLAPALCMATAALILHFFAIPASHIGAHNVASTPDDQHELTSPTVRRRAEILLNMAWIGNGLSYLAIYVLIPVMTQLAAMSGVTDLRIAGFVASIWFVVRFSGFALLSKWTGWHYKTRWQIGPILALTLSLAGMLLIHNLAVLIAFQILFGLATALLYSTSLYYAMHVSDGHGGHASYHEAIIGVGTCIGPGIGALAGIGAQTGTANFDLHAMQRIAIGVIPVLLLGAAVMTRMALRANAPLALSNPPQAT